MERLTKRTEDGDAFFIHRYTRQFGKVADKLAAYEDAEEQGLLIRLPCKVGDEFWELNTETEIPHIYPRIACSLSHCEYVSQRLGKTVFLTKAEAEKALERMK